jgi:hypothetical protein
MRECVRRMWRGRKCKRWRKRRAGKRVHVGGLSRGGRAVCMLLVVVRRNGVLLVCRRGPIVRVLVRGGERKA